MVMVTGGNMADVAAAAAAAADCWEGLEEKDVLFNVLRLSSVLFGYCDQILSMTILLKRIDSVIE